MICHRHLEIGRPTQHQEYSGETDSTFYFSSSLTSSPPHAAADTRDSHLQWFHHLNNFIFHLSNHLYSSPDHNTMDGENFSWKLLFVSVVQPSPPSLLSLGTKHQAMPIYQNQPKLSRMQSALRLSYLWSRRRGGGSKMPLLVGPSAWVGLIKNSCGTDSAFYPLIFLSDSDIYPHHSP